MVLLIQNMCLTNKNLPFTKCFKNISTASQGQPKCQSSDIQIYHKKTPVSCRTSVCYVTYINQNTLFAPGNSSIFQRPVSSFVHFTDTVLIPATWPLGLPRNSCNNTTLLIHSVVGCLMPKSRSNIYTGNG